MAPRSLIMLVGIGVASGFFGALFGVGGGIVIVPLLVMYGFDQRRASATSLAAILVSSIVGATTYAFHGEVKPLAAAIVGVPAVAGVILGASLQQRLSLEKLSYGFALLLAAVGVRLLVLTLALAGLVGLAGGVAAGMFGVGGGILFVPTLALVLGLTQLHAEATSLLAILPTALVGTWRLRRQGNVAGRVAVLIGVGSIAGVQVGVIVAESLPEHALRRLFALLLLVFAVQVALRARRTGPKAGASPT